MDRQTDEEVNGHNDKGRNGLRGSGKVDRGWMNTQTDGPTDKQMDRKMIAWQTDKWKVKLTKDKQTE
jgi:hypothetical protein